MHSPVVLSPLMGRFPATALAKSKFFCTKVDANGSVILTSHSVI